VQALYEAYKDNDKVEIFLVYVREAHPVRRARPTTAPGERRLKRPTEITRHKNIDDRILAAASCMEGLGLSLPALIDGMDGPTEKAYGGYPAGTAVVDLNGRVVFYSRGPRGCQPKKAEKALRGLLTKAGRLSGSPTTRPNTRPATPPSTQPSTGPTTIPAR
jgi:hypothetical protein